MRNPRMDLPKMDLLEPRRLFAFVPTGASTVTGDEYQSVDKIVALPGGGFVAAGMFAGRTDFGSGLSLNPGEDADLFLQLVKGSRRSTLTLGTNDDNELKYNDDRVDFAAAPRRLNDTEFPLGVSGQPRRSDEYVSQMRVGPEGKLYVAITFNSEISLNTNNPKARTLTPKDEFEDEYFDSAILRYSFNTGKLILEDVRQIGGPFNDVIDDFVFDSAGNMLISGSFERGCDFDPTSKKAIYDPEGRGDAFVAKYGRNGKLRWVAQLGGDTAIRSELEAGYSVAASPDGGVFVGGTFADDATFRLNGGSEQEEIVSAHDATDAFTMRLNADGSLDWVRAQGGDDYDGIRAITPAPDGGVYSVGYFEEDADLDPTEGENIFTANDDANDNDTPTDLFITRFDADGNAANVRHVSGEGYELVASASTTSAGDLILAGSFSGTLDPGNTGQNIRKTPDSDNDDSNQDDRDNAYAGFIAAYDSSLDVYSYQQITGLQNQDVFINGAQLGADGSLAIAGRFRGGFSIDGTNVAVGSKGRLDDYREDGFSVVLDDELNPIT